MDAQTMAKCVVALENRSFFRDSVTEGGMSTVLDMAGGRDRKRVGVELLRERVSSDHPILAHPAAANTPSPPSHFIN